MKFVFSEGGGMKGEAGNQRFFGSYEPLNDGESAGKTSI